MGYLQIVGGEYLTFTFIIYQDLNYKNPKK